MRLAIKALAAFGAILLALAPAAAAAFKPGRGLSLDIWESWPDESRWADEKVVLPFPEWRKIMTAEKLAALRAAGFDTIRMPVDPALLLSPEAAVLQERIRASVVDSARQLMDAGFKVILDLHAFPAGDDNRKVGITEILAEEAVFAAYLDMLRDMARRIAKQDPARLALELMNEPVTGCEGREGADWMAKLERLHAAARASAFDTTLVLSGACWGDAEGLAAVDPKAIPDDNVIWSFHSYAPFILTHQGAGWAGDVSPYATGLPYPPFGKNAGETEQALGAIRKRVKAEAPLLRRADIIAFVEQEVAAIDTPEKLAAVMAEPFEAVARWADANGIARKNILLGEFGMIRKDYDNAFKTKPEWRAAYVRDMIALAEKNGFAWSLWDYGGAFGVVEEFDERKAEPDVLDVIRALPAPPAAR